MASRFWRAGGWLLGIAWFSLSRDSSFHKFHETTIEANPPVIYDSCPSTDDRRHF